MADGHRDDGKTYKIWLGIQKTNKHTGYRRAYIRWKDKLGVQTGIQETGILETDGHSGGRRTNKKRAGTGDGRTNWRNIKEMNGHTVDIPTYRRRTDTKETYGHTGSIQKYMTRT